MILVSQTKVVSWAWTQRNTWLRLCSLKSCFCDIRNPCQHWRLW